MKGDAHQIIHNVEGCKEKKHLIIRPVTDSIHFQENGLKEEKKKPNSDYLPSDHHEKIGPVGHLSHDPDLDKEKEKFEILKSCSKS